MLGATQIIVSQAAQERNKEITLFKWSTIKNEIVTLFTLFQNIKVKLCIEPRSSYEDTWLNMYQNHCTLNRIKGFIIISLKATSEKKRFLKIWNLIQKHREEIFEWKSNNNSRLLNSYAAYNHKELKNKKKKEIAEQLEVHFSI